MRRCRMVSTGGAPGHGGLRGAPCRGLRAGLAGAAVPGAAGGAGGLRPPPVLRPGGGGGMGVPGAGRDEPWRDVETGA